MGYVSPPGAVNKRAFNVFVEPASTPVPPVAILIQNSPVITDGGGGAGDFSARIDLVANPLFLNPTTVDTSLILKLMIGGFTSVTNIIDSAGGSLAGGEWSITTSINPGDASNLKHYICVRHNNPGGITYIDVVRDSPFFAPRLYFEEVANLSPVIAPVVVSGAPGTLDTCTMPINPAVAGSYFTSMIGLSPSRLPATSDPLSFLQRLDFNFIGGVWQPYSGNVSEYGQIKTLDTAGPQDVVSTLSGGTTAIGYVGVVYSPLPLS